MKIRTILLLILIIEIIAINKQCYAKYVFEHITKAAEITINN